MAVRGRDVLNGQAIDPAVALRARQLRHPLTAAEQVLWQRLHANRLGGFHFRRQQVVSGFIVDFYCHAARLVVEVDGSVHHNRAGADQERDAILAGLGLTVLRVANDEVFHSIESVLQRISSLLPALQHSSVVREQEVSGLITQAIVPPRRAR